VRAGSRQQGGQKNSPAGLLARLTGLLDPLRPNRRRQAAVDLIEEAPTGEHFSRAARGHGNCWPAKRAVHPSNEVHRQISFHLSSMALILKVIFSHLFPFSFLFLLASVGAKHRRDSTFI